MSYATTLNALSLPQTFSLIKAVGDDNTVLVQGPMGTGKSTLLKLLAKDYPTHVPCYFDCTTKDLGDISIPSLQTMDEQGFVRFVPNEELGLHLGKPIILMIDEFGKANPAVKNAMLRIILERKIGSHELLPSSLVFATTNLGAEGVGDLLPPHARNRMTIVQTRKPTNMEWIEDFAINAGIDHSLLGWVKDNPSLFQSFEDIKHPTDDRGNPTNPYVYHPQVPMAAFVTPRSLEAASNILKKRHAIDEQTLRAALMGTIGERGGLDLLSFVALADQLPSLESIKKDPMNARVPDSASAVCMVVYRTLSNIEASWMDAWMDYMVRLDKEAQGLFANGVRQPKYNKQSVVMTNKKFTAWAMANNYMFAADKK
jgi:energy-coupling factor transporter ATP-binding protein EcfA2